MKSKLTAITLAASLLLQPCVSAADYSKEEVAYVTLDSSGAPMQTIIVNSFKTNGNKRITDYGTYKNIKNLTSDEKPTVKDGQIIWENIDSDMFYYQGEKEGAELPWSFSIAYTLDGKPMSGEEMIGKSGRASITIKADINNKADSFYTNKYMAQITMTLGGENASDVLCDEAVIATVGADKQLTFMLLPKRSKVYTVTFEANNFEMDGLTIAAIKLSDGLLGNKLDSAATVMSGVTSGIQSLLDGSGSLRNGADDLVSGISVLSGGAKSIESTLPSLSGGIGELDGGAEQLASGLAYLAGASPQIRSGLMELDSRSAEITNGIGAIMGGLGKMSKPLPALKRGFAQLRAKKQSVDTLSQSGGALVDGYGRVQAGTAVIANKKKEISEGLEALHSSSADISALSDGIGEIGAGMSSISGACDVQMQIIDALIQASAQNPELAQMTAQLQTVKYISQNIKSGAQTAQGGAQELKSGADAAQEGMNTLYTAADTFGNAALNMADGAQTISDNMNTLGAGLKEYVDGASSAGELYAAAQEFAESAIELAQGARTLEDGTRSLSEGFSQYADGVGVLSGSYIAFDNGLFNAERGAQELKGGTSEVSRSIDELCAVVDELCGGIETLADAAGALPDGAAQLEDGTRTIYDGISSVDIAALLSDGENEKTVSFAAPYAAQPDKVQFLMKTPNLHIEEEKAPREEEPKQNFWQKLIGLFKRK